MRKKSLLFVASFCCMLGGVNAQIASFEAENYETNNSKYVTVEDRSGFSGGKGISLEAKKGSYVQYNVTAPTAGTYELVVYYTTMNTRSFYVKINNQIHTPIIVTDYTASWEGVDKDGKPGIKAISQLVYLESGSNTIELGGYHHPSNEEQKGFGLPIDRIELKTTTESIVKPQDQNIITIEAEDASVIANGNVESGNDRKAFSGGAGVGGASSVSITFNNVVVAEAGTYDLAMYYAAMDVGRSVYVKVNYQKKTTAPFNESTSSWGDGSDTPTNPAVYRRTCQVYLEAGSNTITIGANGTDWPPMDKITIMKVNLPMAKPDNEVSIFPFDYTDTRLSATEQHVSTQDNLKKLFDNDEFTNYVVNGVTSTSVIVKTEYPIVLSGYTIGVPAGASNSVMDSWKVEYSATGVEGSWTQITPTSTSNVNNLRICATGYRDNNVAQYFKLTATGSTDVEVSEWQLHGVPYLNATNPFPEDITTSMSAFSASNPGIVEIWNEISQNTIDNKTTTKYTSTSKTFWLEYNLESSPKIVKSYSVSTTYGDAPRDIKAWTFEGYDGSAWTVLDTRSNVQFPVRGSTLLVELASPAEYSKYKLNVTQNNGADSNAQLLQWQMFETGMTSLEGNQAAGVNVSTSNSSIIISLNDLVSATYSIYNLTGQKIDEKKISSANEVVVPVQAGIYLVRVNDYVQKVLVK